MKQAILSVLLMLSTLTGRAQSFTDHLQAADGRGSVTLTQDPRLTDIVNGAEFEIAEDEAPRNDFSMQTGKRQRLRGYRIQVFWGNSQRVDQQKAQRIGSQVCAAFPELRAYTTFAAPHWRCHVGDFARREDAEEYLSKIRRISPDAVIVRSEIIMFK